MTREAFRQLLTLMELEENKTILGKGEEYTQENSDRLASFKEIAFSTGISPKQVCFIFLTKHYQALANFIKNGQVPNAEDIYGRLMDLRIYLALMRALIVEERMP